MLDLLPLIREQLLWDSIARGAPPPVSSSTANHAYLREAAKPVPQNGTMGYDKQLADGWQIRPYSLNTGDQYSRLSDAAPS